MSGTATGATAPPTYENSGHNNNYTFVITGAGVVVVNSGSYLLAKALHEEIRRITDEPVVLVINENGQGHATLGNGYWKDQGIPILAHTEAALAIEENAYRSLTQLQQITKEKAAQSRVELPTETFAEKRVVELGNRRIEVLWLGHSHSKGDIVVWLPDERLVVSGDMAFHERILPLFDETDTLLWLESWERFEARYSRLLDAGEDLQAACEIDQSRYAHLDTFEELASRNAGRLFEQMEFE